MGAAVVPNLFAQVNQFFNSPEHLGFRNPGAGPSINAALPAHLAAGGRRSAAPPEGNAPGAQETFEALTYNARMERVSIAAEFQHVRERITAALEDAGQTQSSTGMEQLTFSFFAESRVEELAVFQQRATNVAQGLGGTRKQSFIQVSQQVSMRFSMSMTFTGAALNGFAGTAEALQNGNGAAFDQFLSFANDLMKQLDDIANEIFSLMQDMVQQRGELQERIDTFIGELRALGLLDGGNTSGNAFPVSSLQTGFMAQRVSIQLEFEFEYTQIVQFQQSEVQAADPIVLDLDGRGIHLTSHRDGARFDITGTGRVVNTAFVTGGDAFLAIDRNGNGIIDDGTELFGDQNGAANGFEELRKLDSNGDGRINALDDRFHELLLWRDNGNGITEPGELMTLTEAGIREICLAYENVDKAAAGGNRITQTASFVWEDGSRGKAADVLLNYTV